MKERNRVVGLVGRLKAVFGPPPAIAVVLGSGWKERADGLLVGARREALASLPGWPVPGVIGHGGDILVGDLEGLRVALVEGRVHSYEGRPARQLVRGLRALVRWGAESVLLLNAAGSLREDRPPGSMMPFLDHLNLGLPSPLAADQSEDGRARFLDLADLYDPEWRDRLLAARPDLRPGVYAGLPGPSYETPAEVRMLAALGADAVGMSTIPEALAARAAGARVLAVSLLSNFATGIGGSRPSHREVLETAARHGQMAGEVLRAAILAGRA